MRQLMSLLSLSFMVSVGVGCAKVDPCNVDSKGLKEGTELYRACNESFANNGPGLYLSLGGESLLDRAPQGADGTYLSTSDLIGDACDLPCVTQYPNESSAISSQLPTGSQIFGNRSEQKMVDVNSEILEDSRQSIKEATDQYNKLGSKRGACSYGCQAYIQLEMAKLLKERGRLRVAAPLMNSPEWREPYRARP